MKRVTERIRDALPEPRTWFDEKLKEIADRLAETWEVAAKKPMVFAQFAIPPHTKPHPVLVHNIAFASIRFAHAVGREEQMRMALDKACENEQLRPAIILARATHLSGSKYTAADSGDIDNEDRNTFYRALGRRLTYLQRLSPDDAKSFAAKLIDKCFRVGPHAGDAAVLMAAANLGIHDQVRAAGLRGYKVRVRQDPETRMLLGPMLDLFWTAEMGESTE